MDYLQGNLQYPREGNRLKPDKLLNSTEQFGYKCINKESFEYYCFNIQGASSICLMLCVFLYLPGTVAETIAILTSGKQNLFNSKPQYLSKFKPLGVRSCD